MCTRRLLLHHVFRLLPVTWRSKHQHTPRHATSGSLEFPDTFSSSARLTASARHPMYNHNISSAYLHRFIPTAGPAGHACACCFVAMNCGLKLKAKLHMRSLVSHEVAAGASSVSRLLRGSILHVPIHKAPTAQPPRVYGDPAQLDVCACLHVSAACGRPAAQLAQNYPRPLHSAHQCDGPALVRRS